MKTVYGKKIATLTDILHSFERYYDVRTEGVESPFCAEAVFHSHTEQYFLVKAAHLSDIDSNEYVFFAKADFLTSAQLEQFSLTAWNRGLSRVHPYNGHRSSDITLVLLADKMEEEACKRVKKLHFSKSYRFSFYGWSNFRVLVYETSTGRAFANHHGSDLKKLVAK